eukprot:Clim_evm215s157 gene=Clim_evmTU215s157
MTSGMGFGYQDIAPADGGGFLNQHDYSTAGGFTTSQSAGGDGKVSREKFITPVTIKQAKEAKKESSESNLFMATTGQELNEVRIVACLRAKSTKSATRVMYGIEDGTGFLDCMHWIDDSDKDDHQSRSFDSLKEGSYVRVSGGLRDFNGKITLNSHKIESITDMNEVTYHMVSVAHAIKINKSGMQNATVGQKGLPFHAGTGATLAATAGGVRQMEVDEQPMDPTEKRIADFIKSKACDADGQPLGDHPGVSVSDIAEHLGIKEPETTKILNQMAEDGNIYSTMDEFHFQITG